VFEKWNSVNAKKSYLIDWNLRNRTADIPIENKPFPKVKITGRERCSTQSKLGSGVVLSEAGILENSHFLPGI